MALPKSTCQSDLEVQACLEVSVDITSVSANSTLTMEIPAPRNFVVGRAVSFFHDAAINSGLLISDCRCVFNSGKKIRFNVVNATAGALDPSAQTFRFWQN